MPTEINGLTYYTADEVRQDYVPKAEHLDRLKAKEAKAQETAALALQSQADLKAALDRAKALEAQAKDADALRAEIRSARDAAALARVGVPETALPFLRLAHEQALAAVPEAERPADADAAFREWLAAENGARTSLLGHLFAQPAPAPAAPAPAQAPAPAPAPAQASAATATPTPPRPSVMPPSVVGGAPVPPAPALDVGRLAAERQSLASSYARAPASERPAIRAKVEALDAQIASAAPSAAR